MSSVVPAISEGRAASVAGFAAGFVEQVALDVVIFRFAAEINVRLLEVRPQRLRELLLEIARLPDLAYVQVSARAEADVRKQTLWRPVASVLELAADVVVLLSRHSSWCVPHENGHPTLLVVEQRDSRRRALETSPSHSPAYVSRPVRAARRTEPTLVTSGNIGEHWRSSPGTRQTATNSTRTPLESFRFGRA